MQLDSFRWTEWTRRECGVAGFLLISSVLNAVLFQWPLYRLAIASRSTFDWHGVLALVTLFVLQLVVSLTILGFAALLSTRLLKVLCVLFALGNAVALYFIVQYGVILDLTMSGNVLNTNIAEAVELAHPKLLLFVAVFGLVPAWLILRVRIRPSTRIARGAFVLGSLMLGSTWLYANAQTWPWIDKNAKQFGGLVLPWAYVINPVRYYRQEAERNRTTDLLPGLTSTDPRRVVVVLVIGESARAQDFSLYGYGRNTNPLLTRSDVVAIPGARACTTYTTASLRCMLSYRGGEARASDEPLPNYLYRHGIEVIWRTNNFGEPPLRVSSLERADEIRKRCTGECTRLDFDEVLLQGLAERLRDAPDGRKTLVVLHQAGSHGPQYFKKYPPEFERFKPVCSTVELQKCSSEELVNAYDNTIVYTDYFLSRVIDMLKSLDGTASAMLYMSDHGESLGEHGLYLHGAPMAIAPEVQSAVPLIVWRSAEFRRRRDTTLTASNVSASPSHDVVFHSVMGALGLTSPVYSADKDLFRSAGPAAMANQVAGRP